MIDPAVKPDATAAPWERQPGEPGKAYSAFCIYRDLGGHERTIAKAAGIVYARKNQGDTRATKTQCTTVEGWSTRWGWVARCYAWDDLLDRKAREARIEAVQEMNARHVQVYQNMLGHALDQLQKKLASGEAWGLEDIRKWIGDATKGERSVRGVAETVQQVQVTTTSSPDEGLTPAERLRQVDVSALSPEETRAVGDALRKLLGRTQPTVEGDAEGDED